MSQEAQSFVLPPALITKVDLAHLMREVEGVDSNLEAQKVRASQAGQQIAYRLPALSRMLSDFLELNKVDLLDDHIRMHFKEQLRKLKDKVPVVHMTFASTIDPESLEYIAGWIRQELHPQALISVGLQPSLIGGVYIRTPNHVHDFSMRALFKGKTEVLVRDLEGLNSAR
jgi:F0F1-type ATP synthase delta subunit